MIEEHTEKNIRSIYNREQEARAKLPRTHKIANVIANFSGTVLFLGLNATFFVAWILINSYKQIQFDPYPFTLLTLWLSIESIFLSTFLLISQNASSALSERRHDLDLQVNLLAEQEATELINVVLLIAEKMEIPEDKLSKLREMAVDTDPEDVLRKIAEIQDQPTETKQQK